MGGYISRIEKLDHLEAGAWLCLKVLILNWERFVPFSEFSLGRLFLPRWSSKAVPCCKEYTKESDASQKGANLYI